jgi:hypothetical protein
MIFRLNYGVIDYNAHYECNEQSATAFFVSAKSPTPVRMRIFRQQYDATCGFSRTELVLTLPEGQQYCSMNILLIDG